MNFAVGAGILSRMRQYQDSPATDEVYFPSSVNWQWSEAFDTGGRRYTYIRSSRLVLVTDPTAWVSEDELLNPEPPVPPVPPQPTTLWPSSERVADILSAPLANVQANWPLLATALDEQGIGDRATKIAAIATVGVETSRFLPIEEYRNADGTIPDYWNGYDGGATYHGRGLIQLTHLYNYRHFGQALGVDLAGNPSLALDPTISARVFALYFKEHNIQVLANKPDWYAVRVNVNGSPPNGWQRFADLVDALVAL